MSEFIIRTVDNAYSYTSSIPVGVVFDPKVNVKTGDTQGFLRKVNKGKMRYDATVTLKVSEDVYTNTFLPMLEYSDDVFCTFDRKIPTRGSTSGTFTFENIKLVQEFTQTEFEIELSLVEVLSN